MQVKMMIHSLSGDTLNWILRLIAKVLSFPKFVANTIQHVACPSFSPLAEQFQLLVHLSEALPSKKLVPFADCVLIQIGINRPGFNLPYVQSACADITALEKHVDKTHAKVPHWSK